jgi:hypothetical protein
MMTELSNDNNHPRRPSPESGFLVRSLLCLAGANAKVLTTQCPEDIPKVLAQAGLLFGTFLYSCVVLTMIFNRLLAAQHFSFGLTLGAISISMLVSACDAYVFLHCSWVKDGISELKKAGWDIPLSPTQWVKTNLFLLNRVLLSIAWAYVVGLCLSLIIYSDDTRARIDNTYLRANAAIVAQVSPPYDDAVKSEREAVATEEAAVKALFKQATSLRQTQANSIARKSKQRRDEPAIESGVRSFEAKLDDEKAKLDKAKTRLAELVEGRNAAIHKAVDSAPNHVSYNGGFLSQVKALEEIVNEDGKIAFIVGAIEVIAVGIEMAAVLAKLLGHNPTGYSAIIAKQYFLRLTRTADEMEQELQRDSVRENDRAAEELANDNNLSDEKEAPANDNFPPQQPVKRKRGRPRKHLPSASNGSGQGLPEE